MVAAWRDSEFKRDGGWKLCDAFLLPDGTSSSPSIFPGSRPKEGPPIANGRASQTLDLLAKMIEYKEREESHSHSCIETMV